jgi:hypothetical protein
LATRTGAAKPADFTRVIVDTTVQPKAVAVSTDAQLLYPARKWLVRLAHKHGVALRQSYKRVGKSVLIRHQRHPIPTNSSAPTARCGACAPISAASCATRDRLRAP